MRRIVILLSAALLSAGAAATAALKTSFPSTSHRRLKRRSRRDSIIWPRPIARMARFPVGRTARRTRWR